jgi:hypothetical protein
MTSPRDQQLSTVSKGSESLNDATCTPAHSFERVV